MKIRPVLLLLLLIVLIVAAYFILQNPGDKTVTLEETEDLIKIDSADIEKFTLINQFGKAALEKKDSAWMMLEPVEYPGNPVLIDYILENAGAAKKLSIISSNEDKYELFGVDSGSAAELYLYSNDKKSRIFIGKVGTTRREHYARISGDDNVYLVLSRLSLLRNTTIDELRDKRVMDIKADEIKKINFKYEDEEFTLTRKDTVWMIDGEKAYQSEAETTANNIADLQTDFFRDEPPKEEIEFDLVITINDNNQVRLTQLDVDRFYLRTSDRPQWFMILSLKAKSLMKHKKDFMPGEQKLPGNEL